MPYLMALSGRLGKCGIGTSKHPVCLATTLAALAVLAPPVSAEPVAWHGALASWYGLYGSATACGPKRFVGQLGVAHRSLPCGTRVRFMRGKRKITVRVIDRGPYIAGRTFDLTEETKNRLACSDLCYLKWRLP